MGESSGSVGPKEFIFPGNPQVQGSKKQHLRFYDNPADVESHVEIAAKQQLTPAKNVSGLFKNVYERLRYVKVKSSDGESMYVNINSAAKKTGLQPKEIQRKAQEASSGAVKPLDTAFFNLLDQTLVKVDKATAAKLSSLSSETNIPAETIAAAYQLGVSLLLHHTQPNEGEGVSIAVKEHTFVFNHSPEGPEMRLKLNQIGIGATGVVSNVKDVITHTGTSYVIKTGIKDEDKEAIRKEYQLLKFVNQDGSHVGIQRGARAMFTDFDGNVAVLNDKYNHGDAAAAIKEGGVLSGQPIDVMLKQAHDLFTGLDYLEEINVCLIDIKPENMFVEKKGDEISTCLADFGSARHMDEIQKDAKTGKPFSPGFFTYANSSETHWVNAKQHYEEAVAHYHAGNVEKGNAAFEKCRDSLQQMALYSVALSVAQMMKIPLIVERNPFDAIEKATVDKDKLTDQLKKEPQLALCVKVLDEIFTGKITSAKEALNKLGSNV